MFGGPIAAPLGADAVIVRQAALDFASAMATALMAAATSVLDAVLARVAELTGLVRAVLLAAILARAAPVAAPRTDFGAVAMLVGPMIHLPVAPRTPTRRASLNRQRLTPAPGTAPRPSPGGARLPSPTQGLSPGRFAPAPDEPILSAGLVVSTDDLATAPAPDEQNAGLPGMRMAPAPPDALWAQTAALSLLFLLLVGTATHLKNRRRRMSGYAGYYQR